MTLIKLTLRDVQGLTFEMQPIGASCEILGQNGLGKTRALSGLTWLLWGRGTDGKEFKPKPNDNEGNEIHHVWAEAEATFDTGGAEITLQKSYQETWADPRNTGNKVHTGHTTKHWYNCAGVLDNEYKKRVEADFGPVALLPLLMDAGAFFRLESEEQRKVLVSLCPEITDEQVVASHKRFAEVPKILGKVSLDDRRKEFKARGKELLDERTRIPIQITELRRGMQPVAAGDHATDVMARQARLKSLQEKLAQASTAGVVADLNLKIKEVDAQLIDVANRVKSSVDTSARDQALKERSLVRGRIETLGDNRHALIARKAFEERALARMTARFGELKSEIESLNANIEAAKSAPVSVLDVCPSCKRPLPEEDLQAAKDEHEAVINQKIAQLGKRIDALKAQGKAECSKEMMAETKHRIADADEAIGKADLELEKLKTELDSIEAPLVGSGDPLADAEYVMLQEVRAGYATELEEARLSTREATDKLQSDIEKNEALIQESQTALAIANANAKAETRIAELSGRERELSRLLEQCAKDSDTLSQFVRARCELLTQRIDSLFEFARWILFEPNIKDDNIKLVCQCRFLDQPPSFGESIVLGVDICRTFQRHHGVSLPIVIENAESVTNLPETESQQLRTRHDPDVSALTVRIDSLHKSHALA